MLHSFGVVDPISAIGVVTALAAAAASLVSSYLGETVGKWATRAAVLLALIAVVIWFFYSDNGTETQGFNFINTAVAQQADNSDLQFGSFSVSLDRLGAFIVLVVLVIIAGIAVKISFDQSKTEDVRNKADSTAKILIGFLSGFVLRSFGLS